MDELMSSLQAHEQKIVKKDKAIEHALQSKLSLKEGREISTIGYTTQGSGQQS
jgi:hypothetical protein